MSIREIIDAGKTAIGIEFGSTRIKAVMVDETGKVLAQGGYGWENQYENGIWTYSLEMIWTGLREAYSGLLSDVKEKYDTVIRKTGAIGFSAMMHGYMAFDDKGELLVPFRTWRNTITGEAAAELTKEFGFNIPERWSIAHLHQAILNKEEHVKKISFFTTLAGYIHWMLSGEKVLGIGDASGMFPIDSRTRDYNEEYLEKLYTMGETGVKKLRFQPQIVRGYQKGIKYLIQAKRKEDLYPFKSLHFEALHGDKEGRFSIKANDQYRIEFTLEETDDEPVVTICNIMELSNHYK